MIAIFTVDNAGGIFFNGRRQSRDSVVTSRILALADGERLIVSPYTAPLFDADAVRVEKEPYRKAKEGDFVFAEGEPLGKWEKTVTRIYLFRWNRDYPHDRMLDADLGAFTLRSSEDFAGSSHEKITLEVYEK